MIGREGKVFGSWLDLTTQGITNFQQLLNFSSKVCNSAILDEIKTVTCVGIITISRSAYRLTTVCSFSDSLASDSEDADEPLASGVTTSCRCCCSFFSTISSIKYLNQSMKNTQQQEWYLPAQKWSTRIKMTIPLASASLFCGTFADSAPKISSKA